MVLISVDGSNHGTSRDAVNSYGVGGGAGGSISLFSLNGTVYGDGQLSARGAHGAIGGGGGSGGRISIDACNDDFGNNFDVRGGVAMLPLRQVQLLNQWASFEVTAKLQKTSYLNITNTANYTVEQPYAERVFWDIR